MQTQFGSWNVVVGVDWSMPSDAKEVSAAKKQNANKSFVMMHSAAGQRWLGFHAAVTEKVYSAALLVAMVKPNAVVYQPLGDDTAWVCAIQDGMPAPLYDQVLPAAIARNTAIEWSSIFPQAMMVGDIAGAQTTLASLFSVLDDGLKSKAVRTKDIAGALFSTGGISLGRAGRLAVVIVVAIGVGISAIKYLEIREQQQRGAISLQDATRRSMVTAQEKARLEADRQAKIKAFEASVEATRNVQQERASPRLMWSELTKLRRTIPFSLRGYKPQEYTCTPENCGLTWLGAGQFTSPADKLLLPGVAANFSPEKSASSAFTLATGLDRMPASRAESSAEFLMLMVSHFGRVQGFGVDAPQPQAVTPPPELGVPAVVVAEIGKWRASFSGAAGVLNADSMIDMVSRWPMRITTIKYRPSSGDVQLEGEFVFMTNRSVK